MNAAVKLIKVGVGPGIADGVAVRVHLRFAFHASDFESDAHVLASTIESRTPRILRMDAAVLRPEVYGALLGVTEGSEVVIPLVEVRDAGGEDLLVWIWVEKVEAAAASERQVIATVRTGLAPEVLSVLQRSLSEGKPQAQGVVVRVPAAADAALQSIIVSIRTEIGGPEPFKMPTMPSDETVDYLLTRQLHAAVELRISAFLEGDL
jgi:hypothetical protein